MSTVITPPRWKILAAFLAVYVIWGSSYLFIRQALDTLPVLLIPALRFLLGGVLLYIIGRLSGGAAPTRQHVWTGARLSVLMFVCGNALLVVAEQTVPSGVAATLFATVPLWFLLLNWLWLKQKRPTGVMLLGVVVGFIGVVGIANPGDLRGHPVDWFGIVLLMISALAWVVGSLLSKRWPSAPDSTIASAINLTCGGVILLLMSALSGEWTQVQQHPPALYSVLAVVYMALGPSLIAFNAYMWLLRVVSPNLVGTYAFVNPVVALLLGLLIGEAITPNTLIAAAVIILGVVLVIGGQAFQAGMLAARWKRKA